MLEHTKKPPTENVYLGVICDLAMLDDVKALLETKGCTIQQEEKSRFTPEELFPDRHPGHALQGARYREGLSQKCLSELTGVSVQNISAMENGRRAIGKEMAKRFGTALNIDWKLFL